jgi:hypothetical protein
MKQIMSIRPHPHFPYHPKTRLMLQVGSNDPGPSPEDSNLTMLHFALNACRRFFSLSVDLSFPCIYLNLCLTRTTVSDEVKNMLNAMLAKRLFKA